MKKWVLRLQHQSGAIPYAAFYSVGYLASFFTYNTRLMPLAGANKLAEVLALPLQEILLTYDLGICNKSDVCFPFQ